VGKGEDINLRGKLRMEEESRGKEQQHKSRGLMQRDKRIRVRRLSNVLGHQVIGGEEGSYQ